ncbi:phosphopantothenate--cysteine ligase, partial [Streptococcus equi subsp. equi]|nr:phosphopantothenate--cysteine ligase [Streptococcus equi subsp. equi]
MAMKLLITSGGTTEAIDAVRGITNHSTGQLGKIVAETFLAKGFDVTLVTTKTSVKPAQPHLTIREVTN